jgi:hypothetical protein
MSSCARPVLLMTPPSPSSKKTGLVEDGVAHRIHEVVEGYVAFEQIVVPAGKRTRVLDKVKAFDEASRRGEYYESFGGNSKNFMEKSEGTEEWIAECERLLEEVASGSSPTASGTKGAKLSSSSSRFSGGSTKARTTSSSSPTKADLGRSARTGPRCSPRPFRCLSATAAPEEYAQLMNAIVTDFARHDAAKYMSRARGAAAREQKAVLARVAGAQKARR